MIKRYALHPGWISSKNDNDRHYIRFNQLVRLYNLNPKQCIEWDDVDLKIKLLNKEDYIHLYPKFSGNYNLRE